MKKILEILSITLLPAVVIFIIIGTWQRDKVLHPFDNCSIRLTQKDKIPVDHSKFAELSADFESPQEVTAACLKCHNNVDKQLMLNEHWLWTKTDTVPGHGRISIGKKNVLNNFCVGIGSNERLCTKCHAGYDFTAKKFDAEKSENMDCLVCHDNTGKYSKSKPSKDPKTGFGYPDADVNLSEIAKQVGLPTRKSCGSCHYFGGGGNNVKHGDLEKVLNKCTRDVDVHMAIDGKNMTCVECHRTKNHNIPGNLPMVSGSPGNSFSCTQCHTDAPHKSKILNDHYNQVACQTCHIPYYAKKAPTKIYWSWKDAGYTEKKAINKKIPADSVALYAEGLDFSYILTTDSVIYKCDSKHGSGIYAKNLKPQYFWFNGYTEHHLIEDKIDTDIVELNKLIGSYQDNIHPADSENPSKIYPVKVMCGNQIYDKVNKTLINPKLVGKKGSGAFWADFDWDKSAYQGMKYLGKEYGGEYDFIKTKTYWPVNHEVAPASEALTCEECHTKNGRLEQMSGFYLPGRDKNNTIETLGLLMILGSIIGVLIHASIRIFTNKKCV